MIWSEACKRKWIDPKELQARVEELKKQGKTIATLNGSFDLMHAGHLYIIYEAKKQADILIVALNSDSSIQRYKSPTRPIITLKYRLELMSALEFVDYVTWFDETDPCNILSIIKPDVHVNGVEYGANCIEAETVKACGGRLHLVDRIPGLATSDVLEKIRNS
ncbi:MAG: adenylyltransferase/cytidyltransferase family protein [Verrucomicrobia bacterium]|nr:adenylyltransferase/cytidyltransferase family protein [Verrucomicrobiota bacterium]MBS0637591.1 adenylyltransferase/cytidyltransferase family protein [Verrucomicrobiota bacterium]